MSLTFKVYLTPSIPSKIFQLISDYLSNYCEIKIKLIFETHSSGPKKGILMEEDLAFMCTPPFIWQKQFFPDKIELCPYAPVYDDKRNNGLPLYFSDIIVNKNSLIKKLDDLNYQMKYGYNDTESLSGYFCIKKFLKEEQMICTGSHLKSLQMLKNNKIDFTCIDSNVLLYQDLKDFEIIGTSKPHPVQPLIIKSNCKYKKIIFEALSKINNLPILVELKKFKILKFENVNEKFYMQDYSINHLI